MQLAHILFNPKGRINRIEFLLGSIVAIIIAGFFLFLPMGFTGNLAPESGTSYNTIATMISYVLACFMGVYAKLIVLSSKRLRDMGFSAWWLLLFLVPGFNILYLVLFFYPGKKPVINQKPDFTLEPLGNFRF